jgi:vacuolar-type H+-ATPase subunit E/Vma4
VETARGDAQTVREACRELGLDAEVREAADVADGVRVGAADGRVVVENTLGSRLARARREMVSRVAETLWSR